MAGVGDRIGVAGRRLQSGRRQLCAARRSARSAGLHVRVQCGTAQGEADQLVSGVCIINHIYIYKNVHIHSMENDV